MSLTLLFGLTAYLHAAEKPALLMPEGYEVREMVHSPDGKRVAYSVRKEGKEYFVLDGRESKPYDSV